MGPYRQKMTKLRKKNASIEVSICSGCCCGILQLCDVCNGSLGELNGTTYHQYSSNISAEKSLSWNFSVLQILKNRTLTVFELQDWYWYQKKRNFGIYTVTKSFFLISDFRKKLRRLEFQFLRQKTFLWKKIITRKLKWNSATTVCNFVEHDISLRLI